MEREGEREGYSDRGMREGERERGRGTQWAGSRPFLSFRPFLCSHESRLTSSFMAQVRFQCQTTQVTRNASDAFRFIEDASDGESLARKHPMSQKSLRRSCLGTCFPPGAVLKAMAAEDRSIAIL